MLLICFSLNSDAKQILPNIIENNTITISAQKTGELGKNFFYCSNGNKCSTEQVAREYYKNKGYQIMRAEYSFWKGIFVLAFLDELYPQTLYTRSENKFFDVEKSDVSIGEMNKKLNTAKETDVQQFINKQIVKHEQGSYIRWLDEWEIESCKDPTEYFKSPIVQEFLTRIDNKTFYNIIEHISVSEGKNPVGIPDYIAWNDSEMIFVEVKRKNEKLSPEQIEWGKFLIKNKIPYKVVRVDGK